MQRRTVIRGLLFGLAIAGSFNGPGNLQAQSRPSRYLYLWAGSGTSRKTGTDIIAVVDADPASPKYGTVVNALTIDTAGMMPHHSEFNLSPSGPLFVNDFSTDRSFLIDYSNPAHPKLAGRMMAVPSAHTAHSFARLPDGNVVATIQFGDGKIPGNPGGLAEFDNTGKLLRFGSSADPTYPTARIRTYALTMLPKIDRIVTTSSAMDTETVANTIQVWRMSDLKLIKTLEIPKVATDSSYKYPFEVRTMPDGNTAMVNTYTCGFYHVTNLETEPRVERVMAMEQPKNFGCSVPIIAGHFMLMPIAYAHRYATLDISNPSHPVEVSSVATDTTFYPHWVARDPGSDRVVVDDQGDGAPFVMIGHFDATTGKLTWDEKFRDAGSAKPGISFMKDLWPNGLKGMMMPHGVVFVP